MLRQSNYGHCYMLMMMGQMERRPGNAFTGNRQPHKKERGLLPWTESMYCRSAGSHSSSCW